MNKPTKIAAVSGIAFGLVAGPAAVAFADNADLSAPRFTSVYTEGQQVPLGDNGTSLSAYIQNGTALIGGIVDSARAGDSVAIREVDGATLCTDTTLVGSSSRAFGCDVVVPVGTTKLEAVLVHGGDEAVSTKPLKLTNYGTSTPDPEPVEDPTAVVDPTRPVDEGFTAPKPTDPVEDPTAVVDPTRPVDEGFTAPKPTDPVEGVAAPTAKVLETKASSVVVEFTGPAYGRLRIADADGRLVPGGSFGADGKLVKELDAGYSGSKTYTVYAEDLSFAKSVEVRVEVMGSYAEQAAKPVAAPTYTVVEQRRASAVLEFTGPANGRLRVTDDATGRLLTSSTFDANGKVQRELDAPYAGKASYTVHAENAYFVSSATTHVEFQGKYAEDAEAADDSAIVVDPTRPVDEGFTAPKPTEPVEDPTAVVDPNRPVDEGFTAPTPAPSPEFDVTKAPTAELTELFPLARQAGIALKGQAVAGAEFVVTLNGKSERFQSATGSAAGIIGGLQVGDNVLTITQELDGKVTKSSTLVITLRG